MLNYRQALKKILENTFLLKSKKLGLRQCLGLALAENIYSPESFPNFNNSAVDGYAIRQRLLRRPKGLLAMTTHPVSLRAKRSNLKFKVQGEIAAGEFFNPALKPGYAVRIFTGAPVPRGTDAVIMQEHTERSNGSVVLLKPPKLHANIRFHGEDFQKGKLLMRKGTIIRPAHLALLAATGQGKVSVYPAPAVSILATGSELLAPGKKLKPGKIRDSNTILLEGLVRESGGIPQPLPRAADDPEEILRAIRKGLKSDIFLISGGVSVGKYDFVKEVLKKEGVREIFWKVNIKPGKPLFFGKRKQTLVFGLPGNPVSAFVTYEEFVKPALLKMKNFHKISKLKIQGRLTKSFENGSRFHFVRVKCFRTSQGYAVTPLKGQGSHMIGELASANAIMPVKPNAVLKSNQSVPVRMLGDQL